jgi:hypothetical protein
MAKKKKAEIQGKVARMIEEARAHYQEKLGPEQVAATKYYNGDISKDLPDRKGRSRVVSTDVRDVTLKQLDDLVDIFMGPEAQVEYRPRFPEDTEGAAQATDTVRYYIEEENNGVLLFYSCFKDALVRKVGPVKWWYEKSERIEGSTYSGLTLNELTILIQDPSVKDWEVLKQETKGLESLYDVRVTRSKDYGCVKIASVNPEEIWWTPDARCLEEAPIVVHARPLAADKLIEMGIPADLVEKAKGKTAQDSDQLKWERNKTDPSASDRARDESVAEVLYSEAYALMDLDDDKIAERRLFKCVGDNFLIVPDENGKYEGEIVDEIPIALFQMDPEPHTMVGNSNYDHQKSIQLIKSGIQRGMNDSLALSINQKMVIQEGKVNIGDLESDNIGSPIRVRGDVNSVMREQKHPFNGPDLMPVLGYYDAVSDDRSGRMRGGGVVGLNADALQSTTKSAADAQVTASQKRIKMIARLLAETGMKPLFKGVLKLITKHQNRAQTIRLRGKWVNVDPRAWDALMDVQVNVGLGSGGLGEKLQGLSVLAEKQEAYLQNGVPFVSFVELRNTLGKMIELLGYKDTTPYAKPWTEQEEQQRQQQLAQNPPPADPSMELVKIEAEKAKAEAELAIAKLHLEQWKATMEDDRARDKQAQDAALKEKELELTHQVEIDDRLLANQVEANRAALDADIQHRDNVMARENEHNANVMNAAVAAAQPQPTSEA